MNHVRDFLSEEDGIGVVEIILILVVKLVIAYGRCIACI